MRHKQTPGWLSGVRCKADRQRSGSISQLYEEQSTDKRVVVVYRRVQVQRLVKVLTASLALFALATPSAFALFYSLDTGSSHSHSKAQTEHESHHHGTDQKSDSSDSHHSHDSDQEEQSDKCCQKLIGPGTDLIATSTYYLGIPNYTELPAVYPDNVVVEVLLSKARDPGFFSQESGPPYGRPPSSSLGRAPPVLPA